MNFAEKKPHTVDEVLAWVEKMGERGVYDATGARLKVSAIRTLTGVLADDEPRDAQHVADNLAQISQRWLTLNSANPDTMQTYASRTKKSLEDFFLYHSDPQAFMARLNKPKEKATKKDKSAKVEQSNAAIIPINSNVAESRAEAATGVTPEQTATKKKIRSLSLGSGEFEFSVPDGFSVLDAPKVFLHLVTLAADLDLSNPEHQRIFSFVSRVKTNDGAS